MKESKFNILECFDENIDNLDIMKSYVYVLKLIEERYYIGRTSNIMRRIEEHFNNNGAIYTKQYKPLKVIEVIEEKSNKDEKLKTFEYMEKYGWERVRGSYWCSLEIRNPLDKKKRRKHKCCSEKSEIVELEGDNEIKELYIIENKNIIEIGSILDRTPGSIAFRLEKLGIIKRRQLANGYCEYITSDLYKEICNNKKVIREREKEIKDYTLNRKVEGIKQDISVMVKDITTLKSDIKTIKDLIRQHFCSG